MIIDPETKGSMVSAYPKLATLFKVESKVKEDGALEKIGLEGEELDKAIRIMAYCLDTNSPLIRKDFKTRKEEACNIVKGLAYNKIPAKYIATFLKEIVKSKTWARICMCENNFWEGIEMGLEAIKKDAPDKDMLSSMEKKSKLRVELKELDEDIEVSTAKFFFDDKALIEEDKVGTTAEYWAGVTKQPK